MEWGILMGVIRSKTPVAVLGSQREPSWFQTAVGSIPQHQ